MTANPVFINDLRKSLFRRKPVLGVAYMALAILVLTFGVAIGVPMDLHPTHHLPLWNIPDLLLPIVVPAFAAGTFAKEYEQRTWQDVLLTRLQTREILGGKFFACLLPTLIAIVVMFPAFAMLMILQGVNWALDPGPWMLVVLIKFLISASFYIALVMVCSYYSKSGRTALVSSYVVLAFYGIFSYLCSYVFSVLFTPPVETPYGSYAFNTDPLQTPVHQFELSTFELITMFLSALFTLLLFFHLKLRLGRRG